VTVSPPVLPQCADAAHRAASAFAFALLDDAAPHGAVDGVAVDPAGTASVRMSRLYTELVREHRCGDPSTLDAVWAAVDADLAAGLHVVVLGDYEWGVALAASGARGMPADGGALRVMCFARCERLTPQQTTDWLASVALSPAPPSGIADVSASVTRTAFDAAIEAIHRALYAGESYQINYTFRLDFGVYGDPIALYRQLRARQPVAFGALIRTDAGWVLSVSPELFVRHEQGVIRAKPMKGTAARVPTDAIADRLAARTLQADEKNRAENVMIVDLLRNDLGRIARVGSVEVERLFDVEPFPSVWQMTSTVRADLAPSMRFPDVLRALFPCGSITGAPKQAAMALIRQIETTPRGLYTGTIGWIDPAPLSRSDGDVCHGDPDRRAEGANVGGDTADDRDGGNGDVMTRCGAFCLSVAIRTLTIQDPLRPEAHTPSVLHTLTDEAMGRLLPAEVGIGAGIVLDSRAADEYDECWLKARFLTGADPGFALFETIALDLSAMPFGVDGTVPRMHDAIAANASIDRPSHAVRSAAFAKAMPYLPRHLTRLEAAAKRLGFTWSIDRVMACIDRQLAMHPASSRTVGQTAEQPSWQEGSARATPAEQPPKEGAYSGLFTPTHRMRLALTKEGAVTCAIASMPPLTDGPVGLLMARDHGHAPTRADDFLLRFKTTARAHYDAAWQSAAAQGAFDMLFENTAGELTEGGRSTFYLQLEGRWYTPPLRSGLLPGVMRQAVLEGAIPGVPTVSERVLHRADLATAQACALSNGLRGWIAASLPQVA
jgi:para-aminobenzoate synthetase/4-amino-4-deoxychorismate lyase